MLPRSNTAGSTSSAVSVAFGVVLGAALTFGMQLHSNRVQERRIAHQTRAQHLERLMVASQRFKTATSTFSIKVIDATVKWRSGQTPNYENLVPEHGPAEEMAAVCALYVPEVTVEARRLEQANFAIRQGFLESLPRVVEALKPGDPVPTVDQLIDKKLRSELAQATDALEKKLIELAKQNRQ